MMRFYFQYDSSTKYYEEDKRTKALDQVNEYYYSMYYCFNDYSISEHS